jgi:hypothetical protein
MVEDAASSDKRSLFTVEYMCTSMSYMLQGPKSPKSTQQTCQIETWPRASTSENVESKAYLHREKVRLLNAQLK